MRSAILRSHDEDVIARPKEPATAQHVAREPSPPGETARVAA